jgi:hypothetical protein
MRTLMMRGTAAAILMLSPRTARDTWQLSDAAKTGFKTIWTTSVDERRERVGCMSGSIEGDTVYVARVKLLPDGPADSLTAAAEISLAECAAPEWIGTVHTHVRSTDSEEPVARFSPGDRAVMSEWARQYERAGAFCVLYSAKGAHCEIWPPRTEPRVVK